MTTVPLYSSGCTQTRLLSSTFTLFLLLLFYQSVCPVNLYLTVDCFYILCDLCMTIRLHFPPLPHPHSPLPHSPSRTSPPFSTSHSTLSSSALPHPHSPTSSATTPPPLTALKIILPVFETTKNYININEKLPNVLQKKKILKQQQQLFDK